MGAIILSVGLTRKPTAAFFCFETVVMERLKCENDAKKRIKIRKRKKRVK